MSGLLYFVSDHSGTLSAKQFAKLRPDLAWNVGLQSREASRGPGGRSGVVCADPRHVPAQHLGYWADRQRWQICPGTHDRLWVGLTVSDPPQPAQLVRPQPLVGHFLNLADEQEWMVPIARGLQEDAGGSMNYYNALPQISGLDAAGNWTPHGVQHKHAALWDTANRWWNALFAYQAQDLDDAERLLIEFDGVHDAALLALSTNYLLGKAEAALLGLFTEHLCKTILDYVCDWPTLDVWLKKKMLATSTPASSSSAAGPMDCTAPIGPLSPTSTPSPNIGISKSPS